MTTSESRFIRRLLAYVIANVAFYVIYQRFGWVIALAVSGFAGSARVLAYADAEKMSEDRYGLPK